MTAKIIPFEDQSKLKMFCSFCKKELAVGPKRVHIRGLDGAIICDDCVKKCTELLEKSNA